MLEHSNHKTATWWIFGKRNFGKLCLGTLVWSIDFEKFEYGNCWRTLSFVSVSWGMRGVTFAEWVNPKRQPAW
jgi:hypothetical protein